MQVLVIHNSDEVKDVVVGTDKEILQILRNTTYWEDIVARLRSDGSLNYHNLSAPRTDFDEREVTLEMVTTLYHDGDSEDGYSLLESLPKPPNS